MQIPMHPEEVKRQRLLGFGFNAFRQCGQSCTSKIENDLSWSHVMASTPNELYCWVNGNDESRRIIGMTSSWDMSLAWLKNNTLLIWGGIHATTHEPRAINTSSIFNGSDDNWIKIQIAVKPSEESLTKEDHTCTLVAQDSHHRLFALTLNMIDQHLQDVCQLRTDCVDFACCTTEIAVIVSTHQVYLLLLSELFNLASPKWIPLLHVTTEGRRAALSLEPTSTSASKRQHPTIAAGLYHFVLRSGDGRHIFTYPSRGTFGNRFGQLGQGSVSSNKSGSCENLQVEPPVALPVLFFEGLISTEVYCGHDFSFVLTDSGAIYSFGRNTHGQLGVDEYEDSIGSDDEDTTNRGDSIASSSGNLEAEAVLAPLTYRNTSTPSLVTQVTDTVVHVACGSAHSVFVTENDRVMGCGWNKYGQLLSANRAVISPLIQDIFPGRIGQEPICDKRVDAVCCGPWHTLVLLSEL